ncbi:MAG: transcription antitermination factor NusB [Hydrogenobacter sp.]
MIYKQKARKDAFLILYQWDIKGDNMEELIEEYIQSNRIKHPERRRYARKLVRTYIQNAKEVDSIISQLSEEWEIDRLGYIERNILRIAIAEILFIGVKNFSLVSLDYVKLALKYAGKEPARFVNGILSKVQKLTKEA